ncbi:MAG: response regulator of citrate/malate metabolism [Flavobacteriales bacterium]|jgi:response regulator of citrate/malate metabolism
MENKKNVFIISFNQLSTDFWEEHLNFNHADFFHWKTPEHALNNISTVCPDIIIVDCYWAKEPHGIYLSNVLKKNTNAKIFYITPEAELDSNFRSIDKRLLVSRFTVDVLKKINNLIKPFKKQEVNFQIELKQYS